MQSTNEEIETAKEELQSTNEELTTVNDELADRNMELSLVNNDLMNLLGSVQIPIVMLEGDLRIRRCTPAAEKVLNIIPTDVGRKISDIKPNINIRDLEELVLEVVDTISVVEREVHDQDGDWYSLRIRPYRTTDNRIDGVVLTLIGINVQKRSQEELRQDNDRRQMYRDVAEFLGLAVDKDHKVSLINKEGSELLGYDGPEIIGKDWFDTFIPENIREETKAAFSKVMAGDAGQAERSEHAVLTINGEEKTIAWSHTVFKNEVDNPTGMLSLGVDVTECE